MKPELQYGNSLFQILATHSEDIFAVIAADTMTVQYISPNIERVLGISPEDILEKSIREEEEENPHNSLLQSLQMGQPHKCKRKIRNQKTGREQYFREAVSHLLLEGQEVYFVVLSDYSQEQEENSQLIKRLGLAENASQAKSNYLSNMSHDIRTPLNGIVGMTQIASANIDNPDKMKDCLDKIMISSSHLLSLINDILDMSRIESGNLALNLERFRGGELIENILVMMRPQAEARKQKLSMELNGFSDVVFEADHLRIRQILLNLLSNAVKYTGIGGKISLRADCKQIEKYSASVTFTVEDNGCGMTEEFIKNIYSPFTRMESDSVSHIQGSGLGMSITSGLVQLMGGAIQAESQVGKGSIFTVRLPLRIVNAEEEIHVENGQSKRRGTYSYKGKHFLIVEDNDLNAEVLTELLKMKGATSVRVSDGMAAVQRYLEYPAFTYAGIFMDVMMPEMDGYEATGRIRTSGKSDAAVIPIVAMTANAYREDICKALESGMDAHVAKPFDMEKVSEVLYDISEKRK